MRRGDNLRFRSENAAMAKQITKQFKLQAPGGTATPAPPIGPALGQHGVNPGQFIQQFNAASQHMKGKTCTVLVTVYNDRSFSFELKSPPAASLIAEAAGVAKGSGEPNKNKVGKITKAQIQKIAQEKLADMNAGSLEAAMRMVEGSARSMGVVVEG
jgi:large subunit ribosomal protein L11